MTESARTIVLKVALKLILREYHAGRLQHERAIDMVADYIDKFIKGENMPLPAEEFFPIWCETWRQSHAEPILPRISRDEGRVM